MGLCEIHDAVKFDARFGVEGMEMMDFVRESLRR